MKVNIAILSMMVCHACTGSPASPWLVADGGDAGTTAECIVGAWIPYPGARSCDAGIDCIGGAPLAECSAPDCSSEGFNVFAADGRNWSGRFVASRSLGTYAQTWIGIDGGITFNPGTPGEVTETISCSTAQLVENGYALSSRAAAPLAASLLQLAAAGGWRSQPFP